MAEAGTPFPLGATWDGGGTNFSVFSSVAGGVELCLFGDDGAEERIMLTERDLGCWHAYVPGVGPGRHYGYRVHGPWDPSRGIRCNPNKLLVDPYAKAVHGDVRWDEAVYPYRWSEGDLSRNDADSAPFMPRSVVVDPRFDWDDDRPPRTPPEETVLYEVHVKGYTAAHPDVPDALRGTYAGFAHPAAIEHLVDLGVTAVELLPVHQFAHDHSLLERGLRNYWGYNTLAFLSPHNEYCSSGDEGQQVAEFKAMVKALHAAGIEVILDVVFNHTAEGNHLGPVLSLKGFDNAAYYRLHPDDRRFYFDYSGTGNSLHPGRPDTLRLIADSLRYWVLEMHVDGFRFDLASVLARDVAAFDPSASFFDVLYQDPVLSQVKLIAEPWDIEAWSGYQVGYFPIQWSEWNDKYRDTARNLWRGADAVFPEMAYRLTGSSDLYGDDFRSPWNSINFVTAHDGFTLADAVSYNDKHNEANGEQNRDGTGDNRSFNWGVEGPTDDPGVVGARRRAQRNLLTTLLLSHGVPMLLGGDELGRTQQGNNNAYCQDNEISWYDWSAAESPESVELLEFTRRVIALRRAHPVFRRRRWFRGRDIFDADAGELCWFLPDGRVAGEGDFNPGTKTVGLFLNGEPLGDDSFIVLINGWREDMLFGLPDRVGRNWAVELSTAGDAGATSPVMVQQRSILVLRRGS